MAAKDIVGPWLTSSINSLEIADFDQQLSINEKMGLKEFQMNTANLETVGGSSDESASVTQDLRRGLTLFNMCVTGQLLYQQIHR